MFFRELETLRARRSTEPALVEALDAYMRRIGEPARSSLNPRIIAEELHAPLPQVIALLELGVESGLFRHRFHLWCPIEEAGLRWLDSLARVSETFNCDLCDEGPHQYTPDEVEVRYALVTAPVAEGPPLETVDLFGAAAEVVRLYTQRVSKEGGMPRVEMIAEVAEEEEREAGAALARKDELIEVLVSLLENARNAGATRIRVRVRSDGRRVSVEDDSPGIAPEMLSRIFEPFPATSHGTGLGLAIARRLVESWGGKIELTSAVGRGTQVTLTLP